jgi:hypothetical protein
LQLADVSEGFSFALRLKGLTMEQHLACILIGAGSLVVQQVIRFVPFNLFAEVGTVEAEAGEVTNKQVFFSTVFYPDIYPYIINRRGCLGVTRVGCTLVFPECLG